MSANPEIIHGLARDAVDAQDRLDAILRAHKIDYWSDARHWPVSCRLALNTKRIADACLRSGVLDEPFAEPQLLPMAETAALTDEQRYDKLRSFRLDETKATIFLLPIITDDNGMLTAEQLFNRAADEMGGAGHVVVLGVAELIFDNLEYPNSGPAPDGLTDAVRAWARPVVAQVRAIYPEWF